jgi:RNA polymerase sigma-70 factor, ECF subfamily
MENDKDLTDEEVVSRVRLSDPDFYAVIVRRYENKLLRYAINLVQNEDEAAHIVQDAFIKAYINLNGFNIKKKFSSWIYRIVHNEAMNAIKKYKKEVAIPNNFYFKDGQDMEKDFEQKEMSVHIKDCLNLMSLIYSEPLSLYYLDEKSYEEISDILKIPMGTVAIRMNRAKKIMKKICQKK